jgi:hypothetical protein
MNDTCGCCEGTTALTPEPINNRPSLDALSYRAGIHATFLETMKARLSTAEHPELRDLTTRDSADPAIALLDAWAIVADVLTFYQERIANEGYLRTWPSHSKIPSRTRSRSRPARAPRACQGLASCRSLSRAPSH